MGTLGDFKWLSLISRGRKATSPRLSRSSKPYLTLCSKGVLSFYSRLLSQTRSWRLASDILRMFPRCMANLDEQGRAAHKARHYVDQARIDGPTGNRSARIGQLDRYLCKTRRGVALD